MHCLTKRTIKKVPVLKELFIIYDLLFGEGLKHYEPMP